MPSPEGESLLDAATRKAAWRLVPFLLLLYVLAFLDRVNVGYAKQAFLRDTGLDESAYAFGAGVFFVAYAILAVPSNLILHRVGARVWLCRIMVVWGLVSAATMFARSAGEFYLVRFLLGAAEAGFFPGVILYLGYWFPSSVRGSVLGIFYLGPSLAQILGGPLSGLLLEMNGRAGLKGWQWMFLIEGSLAVPVGLWTYWHLTNRPAEATWLSVGERRALQGAIDEEAKEKGGPSRQTFWTVLRQGRVLHLAVIYGLIQISVYGVTFYLPTQVGRLLGREVGLVVGLVSAIPWLCSLAAAYAVPLLARWTGRRKWVAATTLALSGAGIALSSTHWPILGLAGLCLATAGFIGVQPVFWTFPADELSGVAAAGGIALINSFGAVGSFLAPNVRALAEKSWSSSLAGLFTLAVATLLGSGLILGFADRRRSG